MGMDTGHRASGVNLARRVAIAIHSVLDATVSNWTPLTRIRRASTPKTKARIDGCYWRQRPHHRLCDCAARGGVRGTLVQSPVPGIQSRPSTILTPFPPVAARDGKRLLYEQGPKGTSWAATTVSTIRAACWIVYGLSRSRLVLRKIQSLAGRGFRSGSSLLGPSPPSGGASLVVLMSLDGPTDPRRPLVVVAGRSRGRCCGPRAVAALRRS